MDIQDLRFAYGGTAPWLIDVPAMSVAAAQQVLVTGASGRGKSTLLHLIAGLVEPNHGRIAIEGHDVTAMSPARRDELRGRRVGLIFQTFNLLIGFSAIENVMLAMVVSDIPPREHRDRARALLDELGLDRHDADPEHMSVGQKQRVAVARAIAAEPALVLADEPTASLDPDNAAAAMDLIQGACRTHGAALVCTSHDPAMQERFDRRVSLDTLREVAGA